MKSNSIKNNKIFYICDTFNEINRILKFGLLSLLSTGKRNEYNLYICYKKINK